MFVRLSVTHGILYQGFDPLHPLHRVQIKSIIENLRLNISSVVAIEEYLLLTAEYAEKKEENEAALGIRNVLLFRQEDSFCFVFFRGILQILRFCSRYSVIAFPNPSPQALKIRCACPELSRNNGCKARSNPVQFGEKRLIALRLRALAQLEASEYFEIGRRMNRHNEVKNTWSGVVTPRMHGFRPDAIRPESRSPLKKRQKNAACRDGDERFSA